MPSLPRPRTAGRGVVPAIPSRSPLESGAAGEDERSHLDVRGTTRGDRRSSPLLSAERPADSRPAVLNDAGNAFSVAGEGGCCCGGGGGPDLAAGCTNGVEEPAVAGEECVASAWRIFSGCFVDDGFLLGAGSADEGDGGGATSEDCRCEGLPASLHAVPEDATRCRCCCWEG